MFRLMPSGKLIASLMLLLLAGSQAAEAATRSVALSWDAAGDGSVGYRVYYGTASGVYPYQVDVSLHTEVTLAGLPAAQTCYFVVTAYNGANLESEPSEEASVAPLQTATVQLQASTPSGFCNQNQNLSLSASLAEGSNVDRVEFFADNQKVAEAVGPPFQTSWPARALGVHRLTAVACDAQGREVGSSTMEFQVVRFAIDELSALPAGGVRIRVTGAPGFRNQLYASADLQEWTLVATAENTSGVWSVDDPAASATQRRFYRVEAESF